MKKLFGFLCVITWAFCAAANADQLVLKPESRLLLKGDSTLHAYSSIAKKILFSVEFEKNTLNLSDDKIKFLDVEILIEELKSGNSHLDKNMYEALKAPDFPKIKFHLDSYQAMPAQENHGALQLEVSGTLNIAGVKKPATLQVLAKTKGNEIQVQGEKKLLMTDFGIQPPVFMLGALKTADEITIEFNLIFQKQTGGNTHEIQ